MSSLEIKKKRFFKLKFKKSLNDSAPIGLLNWVVKFIRP
jgi:hypothetical protein